MRRCDEVCIRWICGFLRVELGIFVYSHLLYSAAIIFCCCEKSENEKFEELEKFVYLFV